MISRLWGKCRVFGRSVLGPRRNNVNVRNSTEKLHFGFCCLFVSIILSLSLSLSVCLSLWSWALLERPLDSFPAFYGTRRFNIEFTRILHLFLSWARPIQSTSPYPTSPRSILILSTHLRLGLPSGHFPSGFPTSNLYAFLFSHIRATLLTHLMLLDLVISIILWITESNTEGTTVKLGAQYIGWLGHYAISRKVYVSFRDGSLDFSMYLILPAALGPGVHSASNKNEYQ
jgi:hypothetical protein